MHFFLQFIIDVIFIVNNFFFYIYGLEGNQSWTSSSVQMAGQYLYVFVIGEHLIRDLAAMTENILR